MFKETTILPSGISSSVKRNLIAQELHPYKLAISPELTEDDTDRRFQFCEQMIHLLDAKGPTVSPNF